MFSIKTKFLFLSFLCGINLSISQHVVYEGKVLDSVGTPLPNANILAFPNSQDEETKFSISAEDGSYSLRLRKGIQYTIDISYIGYKKLSLLIIANNSQTKDIILHPFINQLDEVVLDYKIPIEIKEDTIIYNVDAFTTGEERKLREVLKQLPGIEVDREGNVDINGKRITSVLVENELFFTGNSKLAVNNIPADVVDKVEVLDNYNRIAFLKNLVDSEEIVLNIKLKENKKKFIFGDLESGAGYKERYSAHSSTFYYSPRTNINFIGDFNNTGNNSFELKDYIEFEGGFGKLMRDIKSYSALLNDDFSRFLSNKDFNSSTDRFAAVNLRQSMGSKAQLNTYVFFDDRNITKRHVTINEYLNNDSQLIENRTRSEFFNNFFILGKLGIEYQPSLNEDFAFHSFAKLSRNDITGLLNSVVADSTNVFRTKGNLEAINIKNNVEYSRKFNRNHTLSSEVSLEYAENEPNNSWLSDEPYLNNLIPLEQDLIYDVRQTLETQNLAFDMLIKDYWVLNNYNHIYSSVGYSLMSEHFSSQEEQVLTNGEINNFSNFGFGNKSNYALNDFIVGIEYKLLLDIFTIKSGVFHHKYWWKNQQPENGYSNDTSYLLPQLGIEAELNKSEKLQFKYATRVRFPRHEYLTNNFLLKGFNTVFRGNQILTNARYHEFSIAYNKFSLFRGYTINANLGYNKKTQGIKTATELEGIDQFTTLVMFDMPEDQYSGRLSVTKTIKPIKLGIRSRGSHREFFQIINNRTTKNISRSLTLRGQIETLFDNWPNFTFAYEYAPTQYLSNFNKNSFLNNEFFFSTEYHFLSSFDLKFEISSYNYQNQTAGLTNRFELANASIFYKKENSPFGIEIKAFNLFDAQSINKNTFSDFLIKDQSTAIMPRIVMLLFSYKF
ncbi:carboxypeptidase-like regulatory domain-containing protein [Robiginitalea sp. M366]|uniref:carboxypeptidase-like regulatory domain-containing protein n=1 Tax=Robiginitalea aestuariiviva TaxID=3036903 RepID=UPI00240D978F|nr:carboxypeptidase-like regulatory domain-containing protein [Robiginitalea aestuariiviva]MDG1572186.1 carboxypeptidase-like regulatory domain-containing protein [Robiginitalea aestuariiviva]